MTPPSRIGRYRTKCESADARLPRASRQGGQYRAIIDKLEYLLALARERVMKRRLSRSSHRGCNCPALHAPPCAQRGEVSASYADGGVMSTSRVARDPSVAEYRATCTLAQGGRIS